MRFELSEQESPVSETLCSLVIVNRLPETAGYNIVYFAVGVGLATSQPIPAVLQHLTGLSVLFFAMMVSKMQASIADALHDYEVDKENPEKSYIAMSVEILGEKNLLSLLVIELAVGLSLWGWVAFSSGNLIFLLMGLLLTLSGFTYSYPPRIKERGFLNHLVTTGVDVFCVILPVSLLLGFSFDDQARLLLVAVFLYILSYHIVHQAADTYFDRQSGLSTFTQQIGAGPSVILAAVLTALGAIIAWWGGYYVAFIGLGMGGIAYGVLFYQIVGKSERDQSLSVSHWFSVSLWATYLNGVVALDLLL